MKYDAKDKARDYVSLVGSSIGRHLHPEDRVVYYRELAEQATNAADIQEQTNLNEGVPERCY